VTAIKNAAWGALPTAWQLNCMTKKSLYLFAGFQILVGAVCLICAGLLIVTPNVGMVALWIPAFALVGLMFFTGLALLTGRKWAYYLQIVASLIIGALILRYYSALFYGQPGPVTFTFVFWFLTIGPMVLPSMSAHFGIGVPKDDETLS
jgi:hypothetical protein